MSFTFWRSQILLCGSVLPGMRIFKYERLWRDTSRIVSLCRVIVPRAIYYLLFITALQIRHRNEENHERQYIQRQMAANRQPSDVSIISIPPAYVEISSHPVTAHHPSQPMTAHPPVRRQITNQPQPQGLPQRPARIGPPRPAATNQQQQQPPQTQPQPSVQPSIQNNRMPERPTRLGRPQPNNQQQTTIDPITLNALQPSNPPSLTTTRTNRR